MFPHFLTLAARDPDVHLQRGSRPGNSTSPNEQLELKKVRRYLTASACHAGVQPDTVAYNLALKACGAPTNNKLAPGLLGTAFDLLRDMGRRGVEPDLVTYTTLMSLCAQASNGAAALTLYEVRVSSPHLLPCSCLLWCQPRSIIQPAGTKKDLTW